MKKGIIYNRYIKFVMALCILLSLLCGCQSHMILRHVSCEFLNGHQAAKSYRHGNIGYVWYAMQTNFASIVSQAKMELTSKGYTVCADYVDEDPSRWLFYKKLDDYDGDVLILKDTMGFGIKNGKYTYFREKGVVLVVITTTQTSTQTQTNVSAIGVRAKTRE